MATVKKVENYVLAADGRKVPLVDKHGKPVLVTRGRRKGTPRYRTSPWLDAHGKPRWQATVYDRVARKPVSKVFAREKDALKWVREQETRRDHRERLTSDRRTVAEYLAWWLDMKARGAVAGKRGKKRRPPRARTIDDYRRTVEKWITRPPAAGLPVLGRVRLDELSHRHLDAFYAAMGHAVTAGSVQRFHGLLVQAFEEAVRKGYLPHNPADRASVPQPDEGDEYAADAASKSMDAAQATRFLAAARELADAQERAGERFLPERCWSALWHVLLQTALRPGEAFGLTWSDVTLDGAEGAVHVRRNLVRIRHQKGWQLEKPKTKNAVRDVPVPTLAVRELKAWRTMQKRQRLLAGDRWEEHGFVFTTSKGTPLGGARRSFERVMARANGDEGVDGDLGTWGQRPERRHLTGPLPAREFRPAFRIYDLRHSCVTLWLLAGVSLHVVSKLAGHATAGFTATVYAKVLDVQRVDAAQKLDALFGT